MYEVDKGVPIPPVDKGGSKAKYPWSLLDVGDSFFVPGKGKGAFSSQVTYASNRTKFKYVVREVDGGVRVWRVK